MQDTPRERTTHGHTPTAMITPSALRLQYSNIAV
jgi:hypothetical protein